jgi:hypothetical protein
MQNVISVAEVTRPISAYTVNNIYPIFRSYSGKLENALTSL